MGSPSMPPRPSRSPPPRDCGRRAASRSPPGSVATEGSARCSVVGGADGLDDDSTGGVTTALSGFGTVVTRPAGVRLMAGGSLIPSGIGASDRATLGSCRCCGRGSGGPTSAGRSAPGVDSGAADRGSVLGSSAGLSAVAWATGASGRAWRGSAGGTGAARSAGRAAGGASDLDALATRGSSLGTVTTSGSADGVASLAADDRTLADGGGSALATREAREPRPGRCCALERSAGLPRAAGPGFSGSSTKIASPRFWTTVDGRCAVSMMRATSPR
jgi:hypothetical protein